MAEPTRKNPAVDALMRRFGFDRIPAIEADRCAKCGNDAKHFKDEVSRKEYAIIGWCQQCQDSFYESKEEDGWPDDADMVKPQEEN